MEWSIIQKCPNVFFKTGNTEDTNSLKILCFMFVYECFIIYKFVAELILRILENLWFDDLSAE